MTLRLSFPRRHTYLVILALIAIIGAYSSSLAQRPFLGYSDSTTAVESRTEAKLQPLIKPADLDTIVRYLSGENRIAGSESDIRVRDRVVSMLEESAMAVTIHPYKVYLPYATSVSLEMVSPTKKIFQLKEKQYPGEGRVNGPEYPWANGYSGSGTMQAPLIYVNYGLRADYDTLDSMRISVRGKVVLARYGRSYRGIKARLAEEHGAVGLMLYTDPGGDGYAAGDPFPEGRARPMDGVQRGSIYNGHGDPTTPGYASTEDADHLSLEAAQVLPKIPVIPISAAIALELFSHMNHRDIPNSEWQGYLPLRYHVGGQSPVVKLSVQTDGKLRTIWNTVAMIPGSELPNEWVIVGGHRDAWGPGAEDNGSGAAAVIAAAKAVSALALQGMRPRRTMLFATWDAEEWGIIGSTEWVEQYGREITTRTLLYINEDECATGRLFEASSDPLLRPFIWDVTLSVADPTGGSIYDRWKAHLKPVASPDIHGGVAEPAVGLLGGGSDFSSFYGHIGVPSINQGFDGLFGQYHSMHDNYYYVKHLGDTSFAYHAAITRLLATEALRMANADVVPYDYEELVISIQAFASSLSIETPQDWNAVPQFVALDSALTRMRVASALMNSARDRAIAAMNPMQKHQVNTRLHKLIYLFMPMGGLPDDPWTHNQLVTSDPENGYADLTLPGLHSSLKKKAKQEFIDQLASLTMSVEGATREIVDITRLIRDGK